MCSPAVAAASAGCVRADYSPQSSAGRRGRGRSGGRGKRPEGPGPAGAGGEERGGEGRAPRWQRLGGGPGPGQAGEQQPAVPAPPAALRPCRDGRRREGRWVPRCVLRPSRAAASRSAFPSAELLSACVHVSTCAAVSCTCARVYVCVCLRPPRGQPLSTPGPGAVPFPPWATGPQTRPAQTLLGRAVGLHSPCPLCPLPDPPAHPPSCSLPSSFAGAGVIGAKPG